MIWRLGIIWEEAKVYAHNLFLRALVSEINKMCVCVRERERECVCVCLCVREKCAHLPAGYFVQ